MTPRKSRYITVCQQLLTLLAVGAVIAPAAKIMDLDVVQSPAPESSTVAEPEAATGPTTEPTEPAPGGGTENDTQAEPAPVEDTAPVETEAIESEVAQTAVTDATGAVEQENATDLDAADGTTPDAPAPDAAGSDEAGAGSEGGPSTELISDPQPVSGYGAVGVTWSPETPVDPDAITFSVRSGSGENWSDWEEIPYEHAEEDTETEATGEEVDVRPGTELLWVGEVEEIQVQISATDQLPADVKISTIDPGESSGEVEETPEYSEEPAAADQAAIPSSAGDIQLAAASSSLSAPRPAIYSRKQWGADEKIRDGSPRYRAVKGAVIHHTVNGNSYTQAQVPSIIRGIYAYHVKSQGWSDIGYNFLVDKFGRIWEGRYGGVEKAVRGAHISAYNDYAFGVSAIGNYEIAQPTAALTESIAKLIAWKLGVHGIAAKSTQTWGSVKKPAIIGHRDGGSTACPGRYLYAKLGTIRNRAAALQGSSTPAVTISYTGASTLTPGGTATYKIGNVTGSNVQVRYAGLGPLQTVKVASNGTATLRVPTNMPAGRHAVRLRIVNPGGPGHSKLYTGTVTVGQAVSISYIGPGTVNPGGVMTYRFPGLTGTSATVRFAGMGALQTARVVNGQVSLRVPSNMPAGRHAVRLRLLNPSGAGNNLVSTGSVTVARAVSISYVGPGTVNAGDVMTYRFPNLTGSNATVRFAGLGPLQTAKVVNGQVSIRVPSNISPGRHNVRLRLLNPGGAGNNLLKTGSVTIARPVSISYVGPGSVRAGSTMTYRFTNLIGTTAKVRFEGLGATQTVKVVNGQVSLRVPSGLSTGRKTVKITVINPGASGHGKTHSGWVALTR